MKHRKKKKGIIEKRKNYLSINSEEISLAEEEGMFDDCALGIIGNRELGVLRCVNEHPSSKQLGVENSGEVPKKGLKNPFL